MTKITQYVSLMLFLSTIFLVNATSSFAQQKTPTATASAKTSDSSTSAKLNEVFNTLADPGALDVGDSLVSPSSPLYFLKSLREKFELYFAPNKNVSAQRELEFAVRRLREVKTLIEEGRQDLTNATLQKYRNHLDAADSIGGDIVDLRVDIGSSEARHIYVLQALYYSTNDQAYRKSIIDSIQKILDYNWSLLENQDLSENEYQELVKNIALRQIAGCQFLNLEVKNVAHNEEEKEVLNGYIQKCRENVVKHFQDQISMMDGPQ